MGNNTSTEERVGGGALVGVGTVLAFTPLGPFTSTWMIPAGGALLTGKEQPIGPSITHSDDGGNTKFHFGDPNQALNQREYLINKKILLESAYLQQKDLYARQLNESIKPFKIDYDLCLDQFKRNKESYFFHEKTTMYQFSESIHKYDNKFNNYAKNFFPQIGEVICSNGDEQINKIYVIKRKLGSLPFNIGWLSHSGLLLQTPKGEFYICEYGVEADQNKVSCYKINVNKSDIDDQYVFTHNKQLWKKQVSGTSVQNISVGQIHMTMKNQTWKEKYSMLFWNCHMAQEKTRSELGLHVNLGYLRDELANELEILNNSGY